MKKFFSCTCKQKDEGKCVGATSGYGIREELYQKANGEFFLHGKGGPCSKYAKHCCGNLIGGSKIIPLTYESAQNWVKENLSAHDYKTIFEQNE